MQKELLLTVRRRLVAPHAGAWIEMCELPMLSTPLFVAPHAGAWIEITLFNTIVDFEPASHPTRVRGLKLFFSNL